MSEETLNQEFSDNPSEIEDEIRRTRDEIGATVDELVDRMKPANAANAAKEKVLEWVESAKETVNEAAAGNVESQKKLGIAAGAVAGFLLLATLKHRKK